MAIHIKNAAVEEAVRMKGPSPEKRLLKACLFTKAGSFGSGKYFGT